MLGIGFGLERIGLAAQRHALLCTILLIALTAFAGWNLTKLRFDGNVTAVLPEESEAFRNYFAQKERFRDFSRDITVIVQSPRLISASGLEDLRNLQLEIAVNSFVASAVSVFSIPRADPDTGLPRSAFPDVFKNDEEARQLIGDIVRERPESRSLISPDDSTAIILVTLAGRANNQDDAALDDYRALREAASQAAPADFRILYTGLTPIGATIVAALITDQLRLTLIGLALGAGIALVVFRSLVAAVICAAPPLLTAVWSLGAFGLLGIPVNYLTTVLPTLALILAYADGIVLFFRWQSSNANSADFDANLSEALRRVGPASSLTSITTLVAFLSFSFAPGTALKEFSWLGMGVVAIAFLAVMAGLPVAIHWAIRCGLVRRGKPGKTMFGGVGVAFWRMVSPRAALFAIAGLAAVCVLAVVHTQVGPGYRITDYMPAQSQTREAEAVANEIIGGRSLLFVAAPAVVAGVPFAAANLARIGEMETVLGQEFPPERIVSITRLTAGVKNPAALDALAAEFQRAAPALRANFISGDGKMIQLAARVPSDQAIGDTLEQIERLQAGLAHLAYGQQIVVTGFDVLMAKEFTSLIEQLRTSLIIAIALGVLIIGVATRSPLLTVAAITPNLLPVFAVELVVWAKGGSINLSEVIALTIAFGIAIDNAVHVINVFNAERRAGGELEDALRNAVTEVGPALTASTLIICVSTLVTQMSVLPVVPVLGGLMVATLAVALASNLAILPANILSLRRFVASDQRGRRTRPAE